MSLWVFMAINVLLAVSMWLVLAGGRLSLASAGFASIGAYTSALLVVRAGWPFWLAAIAGSVAAGVAGALLAAPLGRLRGVYLALATVAFGEVVRLAWLNAPMSGGAEGLRAIPRSVPAPLAWALAAAATLGLRWLSSARWGRWLAMTRHDEVAARSIGVDTTRVSAAALVGSGLVAGLAGALYAGYARFLDPGRFGFTMAVEALVLVAVGGVDHWAGPVLGAALVTAIPEAQRWAGFSATWVRPLTNGLLLLAVVLLAPGGLSGRLPRRRWRPLAHSSRSVAAADAPIVDLVGLRRTFGGVTAVDGVDLHVAGPGVVAVVGPNGAGKTSLVNLVTGALPADAGSGTVVGLPLGSGAIALARAGVGRTFQQARLFDALTVAQHAGLGDPHALDAVDLAGRGHEVASSLAYADRRRLEIARALAGRPRLLVLDEPAAGMNPAEAAALGQLVRRLVDDGLTVLLIEHDLPLVRACADRVLVLDQGRVLADGGVDVLDRPEVREAYLGVPSPRSDTRTRGDRAPIDDGSPRIRDSEPAAALATTNLTVRHGRVAAVTDVSISVAAGSTLAVLGANGAGKSSLLGALAGLNHSAGDYRLADEPVRRRSPAWLVAHGVALVPEGRLLAPGLTVTEQLLVGHRRKDERVLDEAFDRFPILRQRARQTAGSLSGGEQQQLAMARALSFRPRVLLLDEPSLGLAPKLVGAVYDTIDEVAATGVTIVLVEQHAHLALVRADRAIVLDRGRVVLDGTADEIAADPALQRIYLGGG